jgi:NAD(P)-dependent dehydrogenase (short-subunit alcohol dehydrogenase family)
MMKKPAKLRSLQWQARIHYRRRQRHRRSDGESFAAQGAQVAFVDIMRDASEALCERVAKPATRRRFRHCDITDIPALQAHDGRTGQKMGDFDILVNNAANDQRHQIEDVTVDFWNERIAINQRPMFFTCQSVLPGMKKKGGGFDHQRQFDVLARQERRLSGLRHLQGGGGWPDARPGARLRRRTASASTRSRRAGS